MENSLSATHNSSVDSMKSPSPTSEQENSAEERIRWESIARARLDELTKPPGSLGRLEELATRMVCIQRCSHPTSASKAVYIFAADHGVAEEGVSAYPKEVTQQMVRNFLKGGAAINVLARREKAEVMVVDVGVDGELEDHSQLLHNKIRRGTRNMTREPAMTLEEVNAAFHVGHSLTSVVPFKDHKLIAVGEMGIGNTTAAAAITAVLSGRVVDAVTGRGTGISLDKLMHKRKVIERALEVNAPDPGNPIDVVCKVGGLEIAAMAGMILGAIGRPVAIILDGFISTAAAAIAYAIQPKVKDILFAGHISVEPGHQILLEYIGLNPILNLGMRLGEGTGAVLAMSIVEAAVGIFNEMATFSSASISGPAS